MNTYVKDTGIVWGTILLRTIGEGGAIFAGTLFAVRHGDVDFFITSAPIEHIMILSGIFWLGYLIVFFTFLEFPYSFFNMVAAVGLIIFGALTMSSPTEASIAPLPSTTPLVVTSNGLKSTPTGSGKWTIICVYKDDDQYEEASCKFTGSSKEANVVVDAFRTALAEQKPNAKIILLSKNPLPFN